MSINALGGCRPSAVAHLVILYPKIAACLCLLGYGGWSAYDAMTVEAYCDDPSAETYAEVREEIRTEADKVCFCLDGLCEPLTQADL